MTKHVTLGKKWALPHVWPELARLPGAAGEVVHYYDVNEDQMLRMVACPGHENPNDNKITSSKEKPDVYTSRDKKDSHHYIGRSPSNREVTVIPRRVWRTLPIRSEPGLGKNTNELEPRPFLDYTNFDLWRGLWGQCSGVYLLPKRGSERSCKHSILLYCAAESGPVRRPKPAQNDPIGGYV